MNNAFVVRVFKCGREKALALLIFTRGFGFIGRRRARVFRLRFIHHPSFREAIECVANPCWADCTTSTGWKRSRRERARNSCAPQVLWSRALCR